MSSWRQYPLNEALASSNSRPLVPCCPLPLFSSSSPLFPLSLPITCLPGWLDWGISLRQENGVSSWHLPDLWEERVRVGWGEGQRGAEGTSGFLGVVGEGMEWGGGDRWWEGWESRRDRQRAHELVLGVVSKRGKWFRGCITDIKEGNVFPLGRRERRERQQIDVNFKPKRELPNSLLFLLVEQEKGELQVSRCNSKCREFLNYLGKKIFDSAHLQALLVHVIAQLIKQSLSMIYSPALLLLRETYVNASNRFAGGASAGGRKLY